MLLLIDAGNTRVKWALAADGAALGQWTESGAALHGEFDAMQARWQRHPVAHAIVSNVAGAKVRASLEQILPPVDVEWFASAPQRAGVRNGYRNPAQLGSDRFAAAIGARALAPGEPLVVATCGTATTIDALTADGHFLGGMILPGIGLMAASLSRNTANLPHIGSQVTIPALFADNTDDAILSGCVAAQVGAIERACRLHDARCILSGGAAPFLAPALSPSLRFRMVENIVLAGLHAAATSRE